MSQVCTACSHEKRKAINRALVAGMPNRRIAARFGLAETSVRRHRGCITAALAAAATQDAPTARGMILELVADLRDVAQQCLEGGSIAELVEELHEARKGAPDELRRVINDVVRMVGSLDMFLRTADRVTRASEVYGKINGEIASTQISALFVELGVRDASELRGALATVRTSEAAALDDVEREAVDALRLVIAEHPERASRIVSALGIVPEREPLAIEAHAGNGAHG